MIHSGMGLKLILTKEKIPKKEGSCAFFHKFLSHLQRNRKFQISVSKNGGKNLKILCLRLFSHTNSCNTEVRLQTEI